jgi:hypothetical protein
MPTVNDHTRKRNLQLPNFPRQLFPKCWRRFQSTAALLIWSFLCCGHARAEFMTIINSPPAELARSITIGSNTQVNLYPGGVWPDHYSIGSAWSPVDNVEINLLGGSIGDEQSPYSSFHPGNYWTPATNVTVNLIDGNVWGSVNATNGTLVTASGAAVSRDLTVNDGSLAIVTGGRIGERLAASNGSMIRMSSGIVGSDESNYSTGAQASSGSVFLMSGGEIHGDLNIDSSYASLTGGSVTGRISVSGAGALDLAGGAVGPLRIYDSSSATVSGGEFRFDGVPVEGPAGSLHTVDFVNGSLLTGVLSDGTTIVLSTTGYLREYFANHQINLRAAPIPPNESKNYDTRTDPVPVGLRAGQMLTLREGAVGPANFSALPGSAISIVGGAMGQGFEAAGASVTISSGSLGELSTIYRGTTLQLTGGYIGSNFETASESRLEVRGGLVGSGFVAHPASEVILSGGKIAGDFKSEAGSSFTIAGGEFRINGTPITEMSTPGAQSQIDLPPSSIVSGTLSDGTPFVFGGNQYFAPGTLTLKTADVPRNTNAIVRLPNDPAPSGLRTGQTLFIAEGGNVGNYFIAGWDSVVRMSGGHVGFGFQAVGSLVNVTGGELDAVEALFGSVVNIDGGTVSSHAIARRGAIINLSAGEIAGGATLFDGGRMNMTGGTLGGYTAILDSSALEIAGGDVRNDIALLGGSLTVEGGEFHGNISAQGSSELSVRGGRFADGLSVGGRTHATLFGADFRIDGVPVAGGFPRTETAIDLPAGGVLSGVFADGTPFAFASTDGDYIGAVHIQSVLDAPAQYAVGTPRNGVRPGENVTLKAGENVGTNFTAAWDSELTIDGGALGANFEAVGAKVALRDGTIGDDMDVFFGAELNVLGGRIGEKLQVNRGGVANLSGGAVPEVTVRSGGVVNITGGTLGESVDGAYAEGRIYLEMGSELRVTGADFLLNGNPVEGLEPGSSITLQLDNNDYYRDLTLSARLLDGSLFAAQFPYSPWLDLHDWQYEGIASITLTAVSANEVIPEPSSFALLMAAALTICIVNRKRNESKLRLS